MAKVVVPHDMIHVHRLGDTRPLIELARVGPKIWVVDDPVAITLEVLVVDHVEPNKRGPQAPVGFGNCVAHQITGLRQAVFNPIQTIKEGANRAVIGGLARRKARFIDAVVDGVVNSGIHFFDFISELYGPEIKPVPGQLIEGRIEHPVISEDSFETIVSRCLSQRIGAVTRPEIPDQP